MLLPLPCTKYQFLERRTVKVNQSKLNPVWKNSMPVKLIQSNLFRDRLIRMIYHSNRQNRKNYTNYTKIDKIERQRWTMTDILFSPSFGNKPREEVL